MDLEYAQHGFSSMNRGGTEVGRPLEERRLQLPESDTMQMREHTDEDVPLDIPIPFGLAVTTSVRQDSAMNGYEGATTLVIRNVPFELTVLEFRRSVDESGFEGQYDILYMPVCTISRRNKGFGFINFISVGIAERFARAWHQSWEFREAVHNPGPVIISPARLQGRDATLRLLRRNKLLRLRDPELKPFVRELE
eukprot:TRINITY_DN64611_c0_g1_i1.p1 TRINITY_DN64611_c0_g1~~TRINITY_DN64611_c0_g1_i1.p1  ORF type:complete len:195 (-),score=9.31 TRINITY_DN64611_c0_g1_i1:372-956(-)